MFCVVDTYPISDVSQRPVGSIEERICIYIVLRSYPFSLKNSPERLGNVQMRGVWRKEENKETSLFPNWSEFLDPSVAMNGGIVKHHKSILADTERKIVKETDNLIRRHSPFSNETLVSIITCYHTKDIEPCYSLGGNGHVLPFQLPPVWHIAFRTGMALVGIVERNETIFCLTFKLLQLLDLIPVELRRGYSPWAFPYTLISCANADKKRLKVISLVSLPVACSHAALALLTHCLSCSMARRTASSSEESMMGFLPRPERVLSPSIPSSLYRFTHAFTDTKLISVCAPAFTEERPSDFKRTARQRMRKQCFSPKRNPLSSSRCCASVNSNTFGFTITNSRTGFK